MDRRDEQSGRMKEIHQQLNSAYCQIPMTSHELCASAHGGVNKIEDPEGAGAGLV